MGSVHEAQCKCGYKTNVTVGGSRASFRENSQFPYYCDQCGLVSLNIAIVERGQKLLCPQCCSQSFYQYGRLPVSVPLSAPQNKSTWEKMGVCFDTFVTNIGFGQRQTGEIPNETAANGFAVRYNRVALQCGGWDANIYENLCPACKQMTLVFEPMSEMFD